MNQVGLAERFEDAVVEFALVKAFGLLGFDGEGDLARHLGEVGDGVPSRIDFVFVGGDREFDRLLELAGNWRRWSG